LRFLRFDRRHLHDFDEGLFFDYGGDHLFLLEQLTAKEEPAVNKGGNNDTNDKLARHTWMSSGLPAGAAVDGLEGDLLNPGFPDHIQYAYRVAVFGQIVGRDQNSWIGFLGRVTFEPEWHVVDRGELLIPVHVTRVGDLKSHRSVLFLAWGRNGRLRQVDVDRLDTIEREGEEDECGEQEEDNVDQGNDLDTCLLLALRGLGRTTTGHGKMKLRVGDGADLSRSGARGFRSRPWESRPYGSRPARSALG